MYLCFPDGLREQVQASFAQQGPRNERLLGRLMAPEQAAVVDGLGLRPAVEGLASYAALFAAAVRAAPGVDGDVLQAEELLADELTFELYAIVIARYRIGDPERVARRDALLAEMRAMQARKHARYVEAGNKGAATRMANEAAACPPASAPAASAPAASALAAPPASASAAPASAAPASAAHPSSAPASPELSEPAPQDPGTEVPTATPAT